MTLKSVWDDDSANFLFTRIKSTQPTKAVSFLMLHTSPTNAHSNGFIAYYLAHITKAIIISRRMTPYTKNTIPSSSSLFLSPLCRLLALHSSHYQFYTSRFCEKIVLCNHPVDTKWRSPSSSSLWSQQHFKLAIIPTKVTRSSLSSLSL